MTTHLEAARALLAHDIGVIVAGGPGTHSVYVPVSGHSRSVTREVVLSG